MKSINEYLLLFKFKMPFSISVIIIDGNSVRLIDYCILNIVEIRSYLYCFSPIVQLNSIFNRGKKFTGGFRQSLLGSARVRRSPP